MPAPYQFSKISGIFFHLKYVIIFGLPAIFAKFDNMDPQPGPICISRVMLFSKVRFFASFVIPAAIALLFTHSITATHSDCWVTAKLRNSDFLAEGNFAWHSMSTVELSAQLLSYGEYLETNALQVWREFDRGLYAFFKNYIFVPICEPTFSMGRKITGVLVSYSFVLLWHGFYHHNIVSLKYSINLASTAVQEPS